VTKRLTNIITALVLLGGFAFGAYTVGNLVMDESSELARNAGMTPAKSSSASKSSSSSSSNDTRERLKWIVGLTAVGVALWITLVFVVDRTLGFFRYRRRQRVRRQY
jgi:galactitol-specific phosphotransferase system IIC component